jgi:adenylate cyclase
MNYDNYIVVVDDELADLVVKDLEYYGFNNVKAFYDGEKFLEYYSTLESIAPDLVLLDIKLPSISGLEVLEEALQIPKFSTTLFASFSAYMDPNDHRWLGYIGFDFNIEKMHFVKNAGNQIKELLLNKESLLAKRQPYKNLLLALKELSASRLRSAILENDFIKRLISPEVFNKLDSDPNQLIPKEQQVAIGFVDIRGFVQLMNRIQIHQIDELLKIYFSEVAECVSSESGFIDKFIGDAVMWFHTDQPEEISAKQCFKVAIEIISGMKKLNKKIQQKLHLRLSINVGIGIACGTCAVGILGSPKHRIQYSVLGPPVNLASRLCSEARSGEILLGGGIIEYCKFKTRKIGFKPIKGFDQEVELRKLVIPDKR